MDIDSVLHSQSTTTAFNLDAGEGVEHLSHHRLWAWSLPLEPAIKLVRPVGFEPTHPKELGYSQPQLSHFVANAYINLKSTV